MSCRNPNTKISAEICETLGSKIENSWNFILRVYGDALEEAILFHPKNSPSIQVLRVGSPRKAWPNIFFWKP
jgi:hypothetical protein